MSTGTNGRASAKWGTHIPEAGFDKAFEALEKDGIYIHHTKRETCFHRNPAGHERIYDKIIVGQKTDHGIKKKTP
jgi:hypothetical protein